MPAVEKDAKGKEHSAKRRIQDHKIRTFFLYLPPFWRERVGVRGNSQKELKDIKKQEEDERDV